MYLLGVWDAVGVGGGDVGVDEMESG